MNDGYLDMIKPNEHTTVAQLLEEKGIPLTLIARSAQVNIATVRKVVAGKPVRSVPVRTAIREATAGHLRAAGWEGEPDDLWAGQAHDNQTAA